MNTEERIVSTISEHGPLTPSELIDKLRCEHCGMAPVSSVREVLRCSSKVRLVADLRWDVVR